MLFIEQLQISNATLAERTSQLATLQKDHDQRRATHENLDANMRTEKVMTQHNISQAGLLYGYITYLDDGLIFH